MTNWLKKMIGALLVSLGVVCTASAQAEVRDRPTVVLVHGLLADGSSWKDVIPILQAEGINVVAVQNPLTSLADDVAATKNAIDLQYFAPDLSRRLQGILAATQGPFLIGCLGDKVTEVSGKPSWWVLPEEDQIIDPNLQAGMAAQINATVTRIHSSHVVMLSHPEEVAKVISKAVASVK